MRKVTKYKPLFRGLTATMATLLAVSTAGYAVADAWRTQVDDVLGTESYVIATDPENAQYKSDYATAAEMMAAAKAHSIKQGEEGTVIMQNDNDVFPLSTSTPLALFGAAAYSPYPTTMVGDLKAGNADRVDLVDALKNAGFTINTTLDAIYRNILGSVADVDYTETNRYGNITREYKRATKLSPGDWTDYPIRECPPEKFSEFGATQDWTDSIASNSVGVVVFARGAGEGNMYKPGSALDFEGKPTGEDPLGLSEDELAVVDLARSTCEKVVVLLNTGNAMEIGEIITGAKHAVDGIAYVGVPNDYQFTGIVNVLKGDVNSTGALSDTYVYNNESSPAMMNVGGDSYADVQTRVSASATSPYGYDSRWGNVDIAADGGNASGFAGGNYSAGQYIVEAEGIYVGYYYYETRYYDSIVNPSYNASASAGATDKSGWDYNEEVVYSFGHGLSLLDYSQELTSVTVDDNVNGNITAQIKLTNESEKSGKFLAQLYVQQPYTDYDRANKVEKSAIMFLNSGKVEIAAGQSATVEISVPTKYLASYDYTTAKTYILDGGTYYFATGAGAHDALNNILTAQGHTGGDAAGNAACVKTWSNGAESATDKITYSVSQSGTTITNVADNVDLNYYLPGTVTYLSRSDWEGTYPINYNLSPISIQSSAKESEWVRELRGQQHTIATDKPAAEASGADVKFNRDYITDDAIADLDNPVWNTLVSAITIDQAVGAVVHGGGQSDTLDNIDNPIVSQNEGVNGIKGTYTDTDGSEYKFNINSQTLLGTSFNPELAYEWGKIEGNSGLWLKKYHVWGTGLTQRRTAYNGRNYEYISEDPMLTNRIGEQLTIGSREKGILVGAKHIGFNDQEHNRSGIAAYMNEQKFRETDLRGFQGALEDGKAMAVMVAFNRVGATNASHHVGMLKDMIRGEWNFQGIISTDLANNSKYFSAEAMIMATITQRAEFGGNNSTISGHKEGAYDATYPYLSVASVSGDSELVEQSRQNLKYQFYAFANSAVIDSLTTAVTPWWEVAFGTLIGVSAGLLILTAAGYVTSKVFEILPEKKEEN